MGSNYTCLVAEKMVNIIGDGCVKISGIFAKRGEQYPLDRV